jgi:hypothetical protein
MNLIQIQEHLKDLPTPAIMAYANGQNPQVPPYMALGEMNRRKSMEQRAAQAPDSSVKEKLESELAQQVALPGIGQGMNMRINPAGMPQPMPAVQPQMAPKMPGMPVPPMARPMPPQQMSQPGSIPAGAPGMAAGGLAELPVRKDIFNYAPGGIVAFADEDNNQLVLPPGTPYSSTETGTYSSGEGAGDGKLPVELANQIMRRRLMGQVDLPQPVDRDQVIAEKIAKNPEYAELLNKLPGDTLTKLAAQLEQQNLAQRSKFQEGEGRQGLAALSQALISAGEATRGQKGMGGIGAAFGGFGKSYNAATAAAEERAAKQQALERAQTIETMKLQADIENMRRAYAEGDIEKAMKFKEQANAREAKIEEIKGAGAKEVLDQADKLAQRAAQEARYKGQEAHEQRMFKQAQRGNDKPSRFQEELALLRENPDLFNKMQGQSKSGTLTFEDAMNILRKDKLNTGKSLEDLSQMAQKMVNAAKLVQGGQSIPEAAKPPEDTRSPYERIMPGFLGGRSAPTTGTPQLPPGFVPVPVNK